MAPSATWDAVRTEVRAFHAHQAMRLLPTCKDFVFDDLSDRLYFLGNDGSCPFTSGLSLHQNTSRALSPAPQSNPVGHEAVNSGMASASGIPQSTPRAAGHGFTKCLTLFVAEVPVGTVLQSVARELSQQRPLTPPISRTGSKRTRSWENGRAFGSRSESRRRTQNVDDEADQDMNGANICLFAGLRTITEYGIFGFLVDVTNCTFVDLNSPYHDHNGPMIVDVTPPPAGATPRAVLGGSPTSAWCVGGEDCCYFD
ncbi:hypothetical protein HK097_005047 [Rhizophlyctis rosea]|uniref:Uncharacterized protein n=1 Tax=Rhizophlyctis rosea TaxID=64517 RepID=A0AAD5S835_9FUNG|nr:hypothetical protein HK097_005047 [Rhizophlyctis rosea]